MDPNQVLGSKYTKYFLYPKRMLVHTPNSSSIPAPQIDAPRRLKISLQFSLHFLNLKLILGSLLDVYESCFEVWCPTLIIYCLSFRLFTPNGL
jgi:hypothetical protein